MCEWASYNKTNLKNLKLGWYFTKRKKAKQLQNVPFMCQNFNQDLLVENTDI